MMPSPGLLMYHRRRVTLTFDLLTPKVDRFIPLSCGPLVPIGIKIDLVVLKIVFTSLVTYGRTDGQMHE